MRDVGCQYMLLQVELIDESNKPDTGDSFQTKLKANL